MFIIPNQESKKHLQDNKSDLTGTIYQSKNISLDEQGYVKLAESSFAQFTTDNDANFDTVDAMCPATSYVMMNTDEEFAGRIGINNEIYKGANYSWVNEPDPGLEEDVIFFNGTEVVSDGTKISYRNLSDGVTWVDVSGFTGSSTSYPGVLTTFASGLAFGNGRFVYFVNTSWAINGTILTLPNEYQVSSMVSIGNNLYIATRSNSGGEAKLFTVDSIKASADYAYPVGTFELASIKPFKSTFVGINSLGELVRFNGGGFDVLATLPVYKTNLEWCDAQSDYSKVSNRGLVSDGDLIYVNLDNKTQNGSLRVLPDFPGGIWCYDDSNGSFYHKYSPSYSRVQQISGINVTVSTADNTFTLTSGNLNDVVTGMPMMFNEGSAPVIPELKSGGQCYFIIKNSSTVFKLATTYTNALAGTAIDITDAGNTSQTFYIIKTNDYGWSYYPNNRGAVLILNILIFDDNYVGRVVMTADLNSKQTYGTDRTVLSPTSPFLPNRGYFITPRLNSANITDHHNHFSLKFKPLKTDDKIRIKYKTSDRLGYPKCSVQYGNSANWYATWTNTTTFTTKLDLSDAQVGDEIEITGGVGAGHIAHISTATNNAGTWTVVLDEAFPFVVANDIMFFNIDNWTYLTEINSTNTLGYYDTTIGSNGKFIQFKIEMRGIGVTIEELQIDNKYLLPSRN